MRKHWSDNAKAQEKVEKPCRHCGHDAFIIQRSKTTLGLFYVQCWNASCELMTSGCKTKEKAIEVWERKK